MFFNPGLWVVIGVALVALFGVWQGDRAVQRSKGASTAIKTIEANNAAVTRKAASAAAKSVDPATSGLRLPYRDDKR